MNDKPSNWAEQLTDSLGTQRQFLLVLGQLAAAVMQSDINSDTETTRDCVKAADDFLTTLFKYGTTTVGEK